MKLKMLMEAIATMEGFYKAGSRAQKNHNPGNLRASSLASGRDQGGYSTFATDDLGWAGLKRQIGLDAGRGKTVSAFIYGYAPQADGNNPSNYLKFVCGKVGCLPETLLSELLADEEAGE